MDIRQAGPDSFDDALAGAKDGIRKTAQALRQLMADVMPGVTEVAWPRQKTIGYGVGPKKMSEHFCYIGLFGRHVNLGFFYGADLDDPDGLLEGSGKKLRHIKLMDAAAVRQPGIRRLVVQASKHLPKLDDGRKGR